jgi:hypothetical protein
MVCDIHGLRHIFKVNLRIAFHKSYPVNPELKYGRKPRLQSVSGNFLLVDLQHWPLAFADVF